MFLLTALIFTCITTAYGRGISNGDKGIKLIIDEDGGADDAMAMSMALLHETLFDGPQVIAVNTVRGNVLEDQCFVNTQKILNANCRPDVKIYRGAAHAILKDVESDHYFGTDGLGDLPDTTKEYDPVPPEPGTAAETLIKYSRRYPGRLKVLALGSLTNVALAIRLDPDFLGRLAQLYVAAGHIHDSKNPKPEFNVLMDVEAYKIIVDSATPGKVTVVPFSVVRETLNITNDWRINTLGGIKTDLMQNLNEWEHVAWQKTPYWAMLDPAAMAVVLDESVVVEQRHSKNDVELCGDKRGLITNNFNAVNEYNVNIVTKLDKKRYKKTLYKLFSGEVNCK